jgi:magnesium-transporting ATPase (P-type)
MAVQGLVLAQVMYLLSLSQMLRGSRRSDRGGWGRFTEAPVLLLGIVLALSLQLLFSQAPWMNAFFGTAPLGLREWLICAVPMLPMLPVAWLGQRLDPIDGRGTPGPP